MFEKCTEQFRRTILFGQYYTRQLGSLTIEPEHLLLGLIKADSLLANNFGFSLSSVLEEVKAIVPQNPRIDSTKDLPLSMNSKRALGYAFDETERSGSIYVTTTHLLAGILRDIELTRELPAGYSRKAQEILENYKITLPDVRRIVAVSGQNEVVDTGNRMVTVVTDQAHRQTLVQAAINADGKPITVKDQVAGLLATDEGYQLLREFMSPENLDALKAKVQNEPLRPSATASKPASPPSTIIG